jgi:hypothetical protein
VSVVAADNDLPPTIAKFMGAPTEGLYRLQ